MEVRLGICIARRQLYCNRDSLAAEETVLQYSFVGSRFVLQYKRTVLWLEGLQEAKWYRNTKLYFD